MARMSFGNCDLIEHFCEIAHYFPTVKFTLDDAEKRTFSLYRMCYMGPEEHWILLSEGCLDELAKEIMPLLETDDIFELY